MQVLFVIENARLNFREHILDSYIIPIMKSLTASAQRNNIRFCATLPSVNGSSCEVIPWTSDANQFFHALCNFERESCIGATNDDLLKGLACALELFDQGRKPEQTSENDSRLLILMATSSPELQATTISSRNPLYDHFTLRDFASKFKTARNFTTKLRPITMYLRRNKLKFPSFFLWGE